MHAVMYGQLLKIPRQKAGEKEQLLRSGASQRFVAHALSYLFTVHPLAFVGLHLNTPKQRWLFLMWLHGCKSQNAEKTL